MFIKVKVFPGSKKEEVIRKSADSFEIRVREKAQKGQANKAVIESLANYLKIFPKKVRIIKGFRQRNKVFEIVD